jgi:hypothetical protein
MIVVAGDVSSPAAFYVALGMTVAIPNGLAPSVDIPGTFYLIGGGALPQGKSLGKAIWPGVDLCSDAGSGVGTTEALESFGKAAAAAQAEVFARKLQRSMVGGSGDGAAIKNSGW